MWMTQRICIRRQCLQLTVQDISEPHVHLFQLKVCILPSLNPWCPSKQDKLCGTIKDSSIKNQPSLAQFPFYKDVSQIPPSILPDLAPLSFSWTKWYIKQISSKYPAKLNKQKLLSHVYCPNGIFLTPTNLSICSPVLPLGIADRGAPHFLRAKTGNDQEITLALQQQGIHLQHIDLAFRQHKMWRVHNKQWQLWNNIWDL